MISRYEQFSYVISSMYRGIQRIERAEMVKYGYKGSYAQYLVALTRFPEGLTLLQLCEVCEKDKAAVSRAVADMEENGLLIRVSAAGKNSHYRAMIRLSPEGERISGIVCERAQAVVNEIGKDLTDEQRSVFYSAMNLIAGGMEAMVQKNSESEI